MFAWIKDIILEHWNRAGHSITGKFAKSIEIKETLPIIEVYGEEYGIYVSEGVKPSSIKHPFAPARIKGLTEYGKRRLGLGSKDARRFAYAVATLHKRKGMPLPNGVGSGFLEKASKEILDKGADKIVETLGDKIIKIWH